MTVIQKTQLLLMKALILLIRALPRPVAVRAGRFMGLLSMKFIPSHRTIARVQMQQALGAGFREEILREAFMHQGGLFVDMVKVAYLDDDELKKLVINEGKEHLENALASGRNLMIITGHMNWEIMGHTPRVFGIDISVMADYIRNPAIQAVADEVRSRCRINVLPPKGGMLDRFIADLMAGRIMAMVIDQRGKRENRLFCNVLGLPAPTNPAPAYIALKGDALVLPLACFRRGDRYLFRWYQPIDSRDFGHDYRMVTSLSDCWRSIAVQGLSRAMQGWMSSVVLEQPEQWFWLHCRWLRRSDMLNILRKGLDFREYVLAQVEGYLSQENVL